MKTFLTTLLLFVASMAAADIAPRDGWAVHPTDKPFAQLVSDVTNAVKANGMGVVTQAGPTQAAAARGIEIPGNRVIGVFNNLFAVRILALSEAAMIEAPIRMYVTENADGTSSLSYKKPSYLFGPYLEEGGAGLVKEARALDDIFNTIALQATQ